MSDLVEKSYYDDTSDSLIVKTSYDNRAVIASNIAAQNAAPETGRSDRSNPVPW